MRYLLIIFLIVNSFTYGNDGWHITSMIGSPFSMNNDLVLHYDNTTYVHQAKYEPNAFSDFPYWVVRSEFWNGDSALGLEIVHHKVYLKNTTDKIKSFSVSDGYNLVYMNYAKRINDHILRGGFGLIFGNPDVTLEDRPRYLKRHLEGMFFGGLSAQISYERWLYQNDQLFLNFETKLTHSYAKLPISENASEFALVPDTAIHFNIGFGTKPIKSSDSLIKKLTFFSPLLVPNILYALREHTVE